MITLVLSSNMKRMLKNNVLVRKLVGIETAGSINILFTDKTGTLTKGKLEVTKFVPYSNIEYKREKDLSTTKLYDLTKLSFVCNNISVYNDKEKVIGGNITDRALLKFFKPTQNIDKLEELPFNSKNKYSVTKTKYNGKEINLIKGAPEVILKKCKYYYDNTAQKRPLLNVNILENRQEMYTKNGERVLAFATYENNINKIEDLTFLGMACIKDDIRKEAKEGIKIVEKAHIKTIMITGDNIDTASSIAREIGLLKKDGLLLTSKELNEMNDAEVKKILPKLNVLARSLPQDKSRLVRLSQEMGLVVGMTGDGVNDAPALKKADVGFAMGSGTEVAKEASDIVILDDNFMSITKAILFGRTIFKSIRKFIIFQLTVNICAVSLSIIGPFIGVQTPVTVIQMLWINMIMDTLAGLAFSFEPPIMEYMDEFPKKKDEPIINRYMIGQILFTGIYSSLLCILFLKLPIFKVLYRHDNTNRYLMTAFFGLFIFMSIFNCFNARTNRLNLIANILKNKVFLIIIAFIAVVQIILLYFGGDIFRTFGLTFYEFQIMIILAATVIPIDFLRKLYLRKKGMIGGV